MKDPLGLKKQLSRQQRRKIIKVTGEELQAIKNEAKGEAIEFTINIFQKVMKEEFGFGKVRMGRIASGIYEELNYDPEDL